MYHLLIHEKEFYKVISYNQPTELRKIDEENYINLAINKYSNLVRNIEDIKETIKIINIHNLVPIWD